VRAYHHTYGLPLITTHCSNNYGPYQLTEKLIPLIINNALALKPLPVYGDGLQIRDWLYVSDHCSAIRHVLEDGVIGETYNIGGSNEKTNIEIIHTICSILDQLRPINSTSDLTRYSDLITHIGDRAGHDRRYAIDSSKIMTELSWAPKETLKSGLAKTIQWYLDNPAWVENSHNPSHMEWIKKHYA
jgi:dTDP-glucose 4,6-dehydratase